jgi:hypothetical protein
MAGLNNLHKMFEEEALDHDFAMVQMEQAVNRDVRDTTLAIIEGLELDEETALEAAAEDNIDDLDDGDDDIEDSEEMYNLLDMEVESIQELMDEGCCGKCGGTCGGSGDGKASNKKKEDYLEDDQEIEEVLATIPESTPEECVEFFRATEEDGSFEQNTALESNMAIIDMLIPETL